MTATASAPCFLPLFSELPPARAFRVSLRDRSPAIAGEP
jgi:hypothetical protein